MILGAINEEEKRFNKTLEKGMKEFEKMAGEKKFPAETLSFFFPPTDSR